MYLLHLFEVGANVILSRLDGQVLYLTLLGFVADDQLRLYEPNCHNKKDQATRDLPTGAIICLYR